MSSHLFFAPGRVNLIGDHTDYNGGLVFPAALDMGTFLRINKHAKGNLSRFSSKNQANIYEFDTSKDFLPQHDWVDYPLGVFKEFAEHGFPLSGYDFHFSGNLPIGASLSSSASIEMVTAVALNMLNNNPFSMVELVKMAQHAENSFVGMNCGIMDQFASGFGQKNHAIALDCNTLNYERIPLDMQGLKFVIANTNKKRGLVDSAYNQRRNECQQALNILQRHTTIQHLCQLTEQQFNNLSAYLSGDTLKRARHAVSENARVRDAVNALQNHDMTGFGQLMNASHASLQDDYEVSCPELDFLAERAQQFEGVLGSRMTGAGFGGCTVTLISENQIDRFIKEIGKSYREQFPMTADFYIAEIGDGAKFIDNQHLSI